MIVEYARDNKNKTMELEEYAGSFYKYMGFAETDPRKTFRLLRYHRNPNKIVCYRDIDESLKEELGKLQDDFSKIYCGEQWVISEKMDQKDDIYFVFAIYNNVKVENEMIKKYVLYQIEAFFNNVCGVENIDVVDGNIFIMNMIYEKAIAFVDDKIRNHIISLRRGSYTIVAEEISRIAYMPYEGDELQNKYMVFMDEDKTSDIYFEQAKENSLLVGEVKKIRKLLEITYERDGEGLYLKCNGNMVRGYVLSKNISKESYIIEFSGKGKWSFYCYGDKNSRIIFKDRTVQISKNNDEEKANFYSYYTKIFGKGNDKYKENIWIIVENAKKQKHGTMLLFSKKASEEKKRLCSAGYQVTINGHMDYKYIEAVTGIDGAVLLDDTGEIYMIGVILDGEMPPKGMRMDRGARYNSAVRYSFAHKNEEHLLIVISEDGDCNFINYKLMFENKL